MIQRDTTTGQILRNNNGTLMKECCCSDGGLCCYDNTATTLYLDVSGMAGTSDCEDAVPDLDVFNKTWTLTWDADWYSPGVGAWVSPFNAYGSTGGFVISCGNPDHDAFTDPPTSVYEFAGCTADPACCYLVEWFVSDGIVCDPPYRYTFILPYNVATYTHDTGVPGSPPVWYLYSNEYTDFNGGTLRVYT